MHSRMVIINMPGLGVGDLKNSSSTNHSIEQLLKDAYKKDLQIDLSGLESIGFNSFVKYEGSIARKSSVTARLAAKKVHGDDDFSAFNELGGGDLEKLPVFSQFADSDEDSSGVFLISIGNDETIVPAYEFIESESDGEALENLLDVISAPLVRNECIVTNLTDYRQAAIECNATLALACIAQVSTYLKKIFGLLGSDDLMIFLSTTAIDATASKSEFKNELTPMMVYSPTCQTHDLGLRLLADIGPSIADFFGLDKSSLIGASMGKWMFPAENPQDGRQTQLHS